MKLTLKILIFAFVAGMAFANYYIVRKLNQPIGIPDFRQRPVNDYTDLADSLRVDTLKGEIK